METFFIKFRAGTLELDAIVTVYDHHQKFKVEMVTGEMEPILLTRLKNGQWNIVQRGLRNFSEEDFEQIKNAIETYLKEIYSVKNMLILTDFSNAALNAAKYAATLTHQLKTKKLFLYNSYEALALPPTSFAPVSSGFMEAAEASQNKITDLKDELKNVLDRPIEIELLTDDKMLIGATNNIIRQQQIGLTVAGITEKSSMEKILIGSNTLNLAEDCESPLLLIPPAATYQPIKKVVFACDLKQVSESTPLFAIKTFIHAIGAQLLILNVDHNGKYFDSETINEMTDLHYLWDNEQPEYHYINNKDIAAGIMEFASQQQAQLVITIPKAYGFFESIFHRSMTKKLAFHTHLPLLLFKEDQ